MAGACLVPAREDASQAPNGGLAPSHPDVLLLTQEPPRAQAQGRGIGPGAEEGGRPVGWGWCHGGWDGPPRVLSG